MIKMPKNGKIVGFKNYERKIKSPFMVSAGFKSTLVPENNGKQSPNESYMNKCQIHVPFSYGYKFVCVDDQHIQICSNTMEQNKKQGVTCT